MEQQPVDYYDPECDRVVKEDVIISQYKKFKELYSWFDKTYEQFKNDNFRILSNEDRQHIR